MIIEDKVWEIICKNLQKLKNNDFRNNLSGLNHKLWTLLNPQIKIMS
jgi:hypothetical protein